MEMPIERRIAEKLHGDLRSLEDLKQHVKEITLNKVEKETEVKKENLLQKLARKIGIKQKPETSHYEITVLLKEAAPKKDSHNFRTTTTALDLLTSGIRDNARLRGVEIEENNILDDKGKNILGIQVKVKKTKANR